MAKIDFNFNNSMFRSITLSFFYVTFAVSVLSAQQKATMTPAVYSEWKTIKNMQVADNGSTVTFSYEREVGDVTANIYCADIDTTYSFERLKSMKISADGRFVVGMIGLSYDSLRMLKIKKTKKDDFPSDSLFIFDVRTQLISKVAEVGAFDIVNGISNTLVYTSKLDNKKDTSSVVTTKLDSIASLDTTLIKALNSKLDTLIAKDSMIVDTTKVMGVPKKKKETKHLNDLIVRDLDSMVQDTFRYVENYVVAKDSAHIMFSVESDTTDQIMLVKSYDVRNRKLVDLGSGYKQVLKIIISDDGGYQAFLSSKDDKKNKTSHLDIHIKRPSDNLAYQLVTDTVLTKGWNVRSNVAFIFSKYNKRLFFGAKPNPILKDTTILDDEQPKVEVWLADSPRLFTQMESSKKRDDERAYRYFVDVESGRIVNLDESEYQTTKLEYTGEDRYALVLNSAPYQQEVTWTGNLRYDVSIKDTETGIDQLVTKGVSSEPRISPAGKYVYWYQAQDSLWHYYDIEKKVLGFLGLRTLTNFFDELNDLPQPSDSYGIAGWLQNDEAVLMYDRYDIYSIHPSRFFDDRNLTNGREQLIVSRFIDLDIEELSIDETNPLLIHRFNEVNKASGYGYIDVAKEVATTIKMEDYAYSKSVLKAKNANTLLFTKENFEVFPDWILTDSAFVDQRVVSDANPQQKDFGWGSAKLFRWPNDAGDMEEGMMFYPPDFDVNKLYPLIVNFYERSSNDLNKHRAPEAHRSSINYSYYTNRGYMVFNPDIRYNTGSPGDDCLAIINSGVDAILKQGFVDASRMGIQGHSWGGYQIAYLLNKVDRFKCAEAGAPVVNMVSAYGGVRWESGMSRMFQYERTQSRLGATLWESPELYHANSPIYGIQNVTTPVLIMHNDKDGAVPWYQGIEYYMALRRLGKKAWMLNYVGEPHWPVKWPNRLDFNIKMSEYFDYYLMSQPMPEWMIKGNTPSDME